MVLKVCACQRKKKNERAAGGEQVYEEGGRDLTNHELTTH
jgi:hypothetical protein